MQLQVALSEERLEQRLAETTSCVFLRSLALGTEHLWAIQTRLLSED